MPGKYEQKVANLEEENRGLKKALEEVYKQNKFFVDRLGDIQREVYQIKCLLKNAKNY